VAEFNECVQRGILIHLPFENLAGCDLQNFHLNESMFFTTNLSKAILSDTNLSKAILSWANFFVKSCENILPKVDLNLQNQLRLNF
jgi:uncharacterized protein YjbI with pentapeptide repeats